MIRALSFDVGGTLIAAHPSVGHVYARAGRRWGLTASPDALNRAFGKVWAERDRQAQMIDGGLGWWRELVEKVFQQVAYHGRRDRCFQACYDAFAGASAWRIYDDVRPVLNALSSAGIKMGVVSNWDERLPSLLEELELARYFDWCLVSGREGLAKPDRRLFQKVVQAAQVPPETILHVGDDYEEDVRGARDAGLTALHIDREAEAAAGVVTDLRELQQRVGQPDGSATG